MRMYFFVLYNISPIQAGIQAGHAALEYVSKFKEDEITWEFIDNHKTFIILNGGTSSTMIDRMMELNNLDISFASFQEPDLNLSTTAIAFLVNEADYNPSETEILYNTNPVYEYLRTFRLASN